MNKYDKPMGAYRVDHLSDDKRERKAIGFALAVTLGIFMLGMACGYLWHLLSGG